MSVRLPLLVVAALTLAGCNFSKAPEEQAACDCKPAAASAKTASATTAGAATAAASSRETGSASASTATVTRVVHRSRPAVRRERSERRYYASDRTDETLAGGPSGRRYAGVSVSVTETESSSERYRYSESTERYGSRGGAAYGGAGGGYAYGSSSSSGSAYGSASSSGYAEGYGGGDRYGARGEPRPPRGRPYHLAGKDRDGYLTWPGKVED